MPLCPPKEGPSSLTPCERWSNRRGILIPRSRKPDSDRDSGLGPGQYEQPRMFDDRTRRSHATMGLATNGSVFRQKEGCGRRSVRRDWIPEKVHKGSWSTSRRLQSSTGTGPGPGSYEPCTTSFCACAHCGAVSQGTTFGTRPATYTGRVHWPAPPGPGEYHVECTTIGAATRTCRGSHKHACLMGDRLS